MDVDTDATRSNGVAISPPAVGESERNNSAGISSDSSVVQDRRNGSRDDNLVCEECGDRRSVWDCSEGCGGAFCDVCFHALHRKGKRALHKPERIARPGSKSVLESDEAGDRKGMLSGWIGPRLPSKEDLNPDMYDRSVRRSIDNAADADMALPTLRTGVLQ